MIAFGLLGCSHPKYVVAPEQEDNVGRFWESGVELLVSRKPHSIMIVGLRRYEGEKHMQLLVTVSNRGNQRFDVDPGDIWVEFGAGMSRGESLTGSDPDIYPPDEAARKITFDERFGAAISAAMSAYYEEVDQPVASLKSYFESEQRAGSAEQEARSIESTLLRRETLFPGEAVMGAVYFSLTVDTRISITVPAGKEEHVFHFKSSG